MLLLSIGILGLFLQLCLKLLQCSLISEALLPLSFQRAGKASQVVLKGVGLILGLIDDLELLSKEELQLLDQVLIGSALPPLLFDLVLQETHLFVIDVALACHLADLLVVLVGLLDLLVKHLLDLFDAALVHHALSALVVQQLSKLLDCIVVLVACLTVGLYLLHLFVEDVLQLADSGLISHALVPLLFDLVPEEGKLAFPFGLPPCELIQEIDLLIQGFLKLLHFPLISHALSALILQLLLDSLDLGFSLVRIVS